MADSGLSAKNIAPELVRTRRRVMDLEETVKAMEKELIWLREQVTLLNEVTQRVPTVIEDD